jgi:hypothetical protein
MPKDTRNTTTHPSAVALAAVAGRFLTGVVSVDTFRVQVIASVVGLSAADLSELARILIDVVSVEEEGGQ